MIQYWGAKSQSHRLKHFRGPLLPAPLLPHLNSCLGDDNQRAKWLVEFGAVYLNSTRITETDFEINSNDILRVHLEPKRYIFDKIKLKNSIVFENSEFGIVNKPSGIPMHPTLDNLKENLLWGLDLKYLITHRLDVPTSGLVVLAKNKYFQSKFNDLVGKRLVKKSYITLTQAKLCPGVVIHQMKVSVKAPKQCVQSLNETLIREAQWEECKLEITESRQYRTTQLFESEIHLLTGRTHQIRAQLAAMGSSILGDEMYGGKPSSVFGLHSSELEFTCPVSGKFFKFQCYPPWPLKILE